MQGWTRLGAPYTLIDIQLPRLLQDFSLGHLRHCDLKRRGKEHLLETSGNPLCFEWFGGENYGFSCFRCFFPWIWFSMLSEWSEGHYGGNSVLLNTESPAVELVWNLYCRAIYRWSCPFWVTRPVTVTWIYKRCCSAAAPIPLVN